MQGMVVGKGKCVVHIEEVILVVIEKTQNDVIGENKKRNISEKCVLVIVFSLCCYQVVRMSGIVIETV